MKKIFLVGLLALVLAIWGMGRAEATVYTLSDGNSTAYINDASQSGMYSWNVDGVAMLYQQWFWYRIGNSGTASPLSTLAPPTVNLNTSRMLDLLYTSPGQFSVDVFYRLTGGALGTHTSDMAEVISITNLSTSSLNFHFFQYTDFDLGGLANDTVRIQPNTTAFQSDPQYAITETVVTPDASRWEVNLWPSTLNSLNNTAGYILNDATGPITGDATWAFQWDRTLGVGGSFLISKDKHIDAVPEPATMLLLGSGLLGMGVYARRRFKK